MGKEAQERYKHDHQPHRRRHRASARDKRTQIKKGIGACLFALGIPLVIAGTIIVIVANTQHDANDVPSSFPVLGPVLLSLSVIFFATGSIMTEMISIHPCINFCFPDNPKSVCWKHCPLLFSILKPNEVMLLNQREAGLHALQTLPSRPVLKKVTEVPNVPNVKRGVRFSDADSEAGEVRMSVSSETSENGKADGSPNTSLLSLRHCKIYPKESEKWSNMQSAPAVAEEGPEDQSAVFTLSENVVHAGDQEVFIDNDHVTDMEHTQSGTKSATVPEVTLEA